MDLEKEGLFLDFLEENGSQLPTKKIIFYRAL